MGAGGPAGPPGRGGQRADECGAPVDHTRQSHDPPGAGGSRCILSSGEYIWNFYTFTFLYKKHTLC